MNSKLNPKPEAQEHEPADQVEDADKQPSKHSEAHPVGHPRPDLPADKDARNNEEKNAKEPLILGTENPEERRREPG